MDLAFLEKLHAAGDITTTSYHAIRSRQQEGTVSVHWEIKTVLYLGVLLLLAGLGILVYKNIDTIGHQFILAFIASVSGASFFYCYKNKLPFSKSKVPAPNAFFDYVLLLACSTFILFIGYFQYQYHVFGDRYGLASFVPMILLFGCAYYFDHLGILCMGIANLAAWVGISVTPTRVLVSNDFSSGNLIFTGLALGTVLLCGAYYTAKLGPKHHFAFTYANFGTHILLISALAAMFRFERYSALWGLLLLAISYCLYRRAAALGSFYFIVVITLYAYTGVSYLALDLILKGNSVGSAYLACFYFIVSAIALIAFLIRINKNLRSHASL